MADLIQEKLDENSLNLLLSYNLIDQDPALKEVAKNLSNANNLEKIKNLISSLQTKLSEIKSKVEEIAPDLTKPAEKKKEIIYMDGVFDIIHSGHFNAIRQAKKMTDVLYVGINGDEEVAKGKGPTLMTCEERTALATACKWGDKYIPDTPYFPTIELLNQLGADFCAHGDDLCISPTGECVYGKMAKAGRMKYFKRTEGVSTTEIMGRIINNCLDPNNPNDKEYIDFKKKHIPVMSSFLATSNRISLFSNHRVPKEGDKIVYIAGDFDLLNIGYVNALKKAKELGDFVYAGVYDDTLVGKIRGKGYPILNLNERVFNMLALKYVDEVIIAPPYKVTQDMIRLMKINIVFNAGKGEDQSSNMNIDDLGDPFEYPKQLGIYIYEKTEYDLSNAVLEERVKLRKNEFIKKYLKKRVSDEENEKKSTLNVKEVV